MKTVYDIAVVGLGAVGSATVMQAASRGLRCVGIDRFTPPHDLGSSHGETRITRQAIGEGMAYVPLAMRSHEIWRDIEARTGQPLLTESGCLILARPDRRDGAEQRPFIARTLDAARQFGIAHELLSAVDVRGRFPQFKVRDTDTAYFEPGGGYLHVERCIDTNLALADAGGAECRYGDPVVALHSEPDHVTLDLASGARIVAAKVVVCAGSWAAPLLGDPFARLLTPTRQVMHWFEVEPEAASAWRAAPTFIWSHGNRADDFYGFPSLDGGHSIKAADEQPLVPVSPDGMKRIATEAESDVMYDAHIDTRLRGIRRRRVKAVSCLYTQTPDGDFLIDWHPEMEHVLVASPCSGHGFKHAAAIGEAIAQLLGEGASRVDLSSFRLDRFKPI